ncbi:fasciclin-like arabinogalactan protein 11 [Trifolium pratense]|uniref:fasciclin-like arabinogalactan protein 11 n=1 Tax=Trifolium pratense TaxID=57577 RepID=UPI001E6966E3|nr:fasciclin-like arabinogalactan protein 11 [Trifolium pratense]
MKNIMQQSIISSSFLLLAITFYTSTTLAQLSPIQPPTTSSSSPPLPAVASPPLPTTATAPSPGLNTVPLVPTTPTGAPSPTIIPKGPTIDILNILQKAKRFSVLIRLLKTTQLINQLNSQLVSSPSGSGGLTIFAPEDSAFSKLKAGFLNSLNDRQKVELLQFHSLASFIAISNFDTLTNPVQTQAGDDARLQLNVTTYGGNQVSMATGAVNASVTGTVYTDSKLAIYQVDKVLLPLDLVLPAKAPALAPAPGLAKGLPKAGKTNSSALDDGSGAGSDDGDTKDLPAEASGAVSSTMWVNVAVGIGLAAGVFL